MNATKSVRIAVCVCAFASLLIVLGACHSRATDAVDRTVHKTEKIVKK